jgi:hypothetical protein
LKDEHGLGVFENRVLRRIFGPKRGDVAGGWRKLRNEELRRLNSSSIIIRIIIEGLRWAILVARLGESRTAYQLLV